MGCRSQITIGSKPACCLKGKVLCAGCNRELCGQQKQSHCQLKRDNSKSVVVETMGKRMSTQHWQQATHTPGNHP
eukprot:749120-Pelagomonas_calceolata.AAC.1